MTRHRRPFTPAPYRPSPHAVRACWCEAIELAGVACKEAVAAGEGSDIAPQVGVVGRLMVSLRDLTPENFPLPAASAKAMAGAMLHLARAFVNPGMAPQSRTLIAPFLAAGCEALDRLVTEMRTQEARSSWGRQFGGDD